MPGYVHAKCKKKTHTTRIVYSKYTVIYNICNIIYSKYNRLMDNIRFIIRAIDNRDISTQLINDFY